VTEVIRYSLIGASDIKFGTGTFEVVLADGRVVILEAINASHIPGDSVDETVDATQLDVSRARRGLTGLFDFDQDDDTTTGLTWGYTNGMNADGTGAEAAGTVTLTANSTNYVEWDPETGAISVNTSAFTPSDKVPIRKLVTNATGITTNTDVRPIWRQNVSLIHGQCYLSWASASSVTLLPLNGNRLIIDGTSQTIPAAGVSLSNSGLTVSTTYNLYAYMNGSTMTLEASTTAHATSATDGIEIKSGDQTRTFVGAVDVDGSGDFEEDVRQWFVHAATGAADARTDAVARPLTVEAPTSGTPAAGIGTGVLFRAESADEAPADFAAIDAVATDIDAGTEDTYLSFLLRVAGRALDEKYRFSSTAGDGFAALLTHAVTADRTYTLPDHSGTLLNNVFVGSFTRDMSTASGTQAVTGVGFTPRAVIIIATATAEASLKSFGFSTVTADMCAYGNRSAGADFMAASLTASIFIQTSTVADNYSGQLSAFGADGFTITWTKGGSITGTMTGIYLAIG